MKIHAEWYRMDGGLTGTMCGRKLPREFVCMKPYSVKAGRVDCKTCRKSLISWLRWGRIEIEMALEELGEK